jgi:quinolinate synthase
MTENMNASVPQADLLIKPEPTMDVSHAGDAVKSMAVLPLSANV